MAFLGDSVPSRFCLDRFDANLRQSEWEQMLQAAFDGPAALFSLFRIGPCRPDSEDARS